MVGIIIKDRPYKFGKTRSEHEKNLRGEGWKTLSNEQLDKCKYLENKSGTKKNYFNQSQIDRIR